LSDKATLPLTHVLLAVAIMAVWGSNFVVLKEGLAHLPPLFFAGLRFTLVACPLVFFLPRPPVPWTNLAAYGLFIGLGQFGLIFTALNGHISPALASLVAQTQVFFTIGLALIFDGERVKPLQWGALMLAASGLMVIALHTDAQTSMTGLLLMLAAAFSWALGNMESRKAGRVDMLAYVAWSSLFAAPPLFTLAWLTEGPQAILHGVEEATFGTWGAVVWQAVGNSLFGYAAWGWLLARHPAALVTPMALLVPIFGFAASSFWLGESLPMWKLAAAGLVLAGLSLNLLAARLQRMADGDRSE
jgi:O-acetylserine/cysteine efflux transporter